jgi:hypothetical protein
MTDADQLAHEAAIAARREAAVTAALEGPSIAPEARSPSRIAVFAFVLAIVLLGLLAATTAGADPSSWLAPAEGCGGG